MDNRTSGTHEPLAATARSALVHLSSFPLAPAAENAQGGLQAELGRGLLAADPFRLAQLGARMWSNASTCALDMAVATMRACRTVLSAGAVDKAAGAENAPPALEAPQVAYALLPAADVGVAEPATVPAVEAVEMVAAPPLPAAPVARPNRKARRAKR